MNRKMPYKLRKAPGRELYWVVGSDGVKHSKEPLSMEMAKKQMTALNIAHARKMGHDIPPAVVKMPKKDFVKEHKRLTKLLAEVTKELKKQAAEI